MGNRTFVNKFGLRGSVSYDDKRPISLTLRGYTGVARYGWAQLAGNGRQSVARLKRSVSSRIRPWIRAAAKRSGRT